jgi:kumamolisin
VTYEHVQAALRLDGFAIAGTYANRTVIDAIASAPVVNRYFRTDIHRVAVDGSGMHYANARPAFMPEELRGSVAAVLGFDDIEWYQTFYQFVPRQQLATVNLSGKRYAPTLNGPDGSYGPRAWTQAYDFPIQHWIARRPRGTTFDGAGRTAAIEIPANPSDGDLAAFLSYFKVKRSGTTSRVPVNGGAVNPSFTTQLEAALDYETLAGVAPGANIAIYEFPRFSNQDVLEGYNAAVSDGIADTINSSFGTCETVNPFNAVALAKIFKQGAAQGQTFHAASGDSGAQAPGCGSGPSVSTPSSTPYGVAVGGTRLDLDAAGAVRSETYWNNQYGAGSGGVSNVFGLLRWQQTSGIATRGRAVPDVSFAADPAVGADIVFRHSWIGGGIGGTSLASPLFGGCLIEIEQMIGRRIPAYGPALYDAWDRAGLPHVFHDVVVGARFGTIKPERGYDLATGLGSLDCFAAGQRRL